MPGVRVSVVKQCNAAGHLNPIAVGEGQLYGVGIKVIRTGEVQRDQERPRLMGVIAFRVELKPQVCDRGEIKFPASGGLTPQVLRGGAACLLAASPPDIWSGVPSRESVSVSATIGVEEKTVAYDARLKGGAADRPDRISQPAAASPSAIWFMAPPTPIRNRELPSSAAVPWS